MIEARQRIDDVIDAAAHSARVRIAADFLRVRNRVNNQHRYTLRLLREALRQLLESQGG